MRPPWPIGFRMPTNRHPGQEAHRRLQKEGRRSRVSQPSAAQLRLRDPRATQRLTPLALSVRQGVVASRLSAGGPQLVPSSRCFSPAWDLEARRRRQLIEAGKCAKRWAPLPLNCPEPTLTRPLPNRRSRSRLCENTGVQSTRRKSFSISSGLKRIALWPRSEKGQ